MPIIEIKGKNVPSPWRDGLRLGLVLSDASDDFMCHCYSGGHPICKSVPAEYRPLVIAAPELFVALKNLVADISSGNLDTASLGIAADLIEELETP